MHQVFEPFAGVRATALRAGAGAVTLVRLDTWITASATGADGWGEVKTCLFVRLLTQDGLEGWGEAFVRPDREAAVAGIIHRLGGQAAETGPVSPWSLRAMLAALRLPADCEEHAAASSALDMALWDICGKRAGKPVSDLLGGDHRRAVPVYANIWSETAWDAASLAGRAATLVGQGYRAVKIHPLLNHSVDEAVACVFCVREAIGEDMALMVDLDGPDDAAIAHIVAAAIGAARPHWLEEPVRGTDIAALTDIRQRTGLRVVTGEKQSGPAHFRAVMAAGAADVVNPDIAGMGGLLDFLDIAEAGDPLGVGISVHCWDSMTVAAAAMLHVLASVRHAAEAEIYPEYLEHGARFSDAGFRLDGPHAHLSDRPGLGVSMDVGALDQVAAGRRTTDLAVAGALL